MNLEKYKNESKEKIMLKTVKCLTYSFQMRVRRLPRQHL